jgi:hypothetical protein
METKRIDEEANLWARHARGDVVEDHLDPAQHVEDAVARCELDTRLPLRVGHRNHGTPDAPPSR